MKSLNKCSNAVVHCIVPHEKHGDVPHILQKKFIYVLFLIVAALFYITQNNFGIIQKLNLTATVYPAVLADLANADRSKEGAPQLTWSPVLENAAKLKAQDMLANSYFAHTSPTGVTPWFWLNKVNYKFIYAGENLAVDFTESQNVEQAWLNSPKHRENIMSPRFTEVGIATVDGVFEGKNTTFVVEFFGRPSTIVPDSEPAKIASVVDTNPEVETVVEPKVAGVSTEDESIPTPEIKVINENENLIVVKNADIKDDIVPEAVVGADNDKHISSWWKRFLVSPEGAVRNVYNIILALILMAMILMLSKGHQKHHKKHFIMGMILIIIIISLTVAVNHTTGINVFS